MGVLCFISPGLEHVQLLYLYEKAIPKTLLLLKEVQKLI